MLSLPISLVVVSCSENLPDEVGVELMCSVAEGSNPHGVECFEHISVEPKGDKCIYVTKTSGQDLDIEERVVSCHRFLIPSLTFEIEEHRVVEIDRLTLCALTQPRVGSRSTLIWRRHVVCG